MIQATVSDCREAYRALRRISDETRLNAKAAWRLARMLDKLKSVVADFERTQLRLFLDHGGVPEGSSVSIPNPVRGEATDEEWEAALKAHNERIVSLNAELEALNKETLELDREPLSMSLFDDAKVAASDIADAGPFVIE